MGTIDEEMGGIVRDILDDYHSDRVIDQLELHEQPDRNAVRDILFKLQKIVFPGFFRDNAYRFYNMSSRLTVLIEDVMFNLNRQLTIALKQLPENQGRSCDEIQSDAQRIVIEFFRRIPKIREFIETDVQAAYEGDPAAFNHNEIILSYPGLFAIMTNRLAHELYLLGVPLIPRIMSEYAHAKAGIDIHPGATIGKHFFIDHGTGIVIGETTIIGEHVKIYQGVTLGSLSTRGGQYLKGVKRHPTIEDGVTIYSGASILGGETVIGKNAVIGGNVFITKSVEPGSTVSVKNQELLVKPHKNAAAQKVELEQSEEWYYMI